jgi:hypothetical protein
LNFLGGLPVYFDSHFHSISVTNRYTYLC